MKRVLFVCAGSLALSFASAASATPPPAISQYVEMVPTSKGGAAVGATKQSVTRLPKVVAKNVRRYGGADSRLLKQVATSATYGAPQTQLIVTAGGHRGADRSPLKRRDRAVRLNGAAPDATSVARPRSATFPAAVSAISGAGGGQFIALLLAVLTITVVSFLAALRRRVPISGPTRFQAPERERAH